MLMVSSQSRPTETLFSHRALQLHPNKPALYILAASHELSHLSPSTARTLLQRGIRLNPDSLEMWREYVRMELGFIESLRRRWTVLGINSDEKGERMVPEVDGDDNSGFGIDHEAGGVASRKDIMEGAIVKSVMINAVRGTAF